MASSCGFCLTHNKPDVLFQGHWICLNCYAFTMELYEMDDDTPRALRLKARKIKQRPGLMKLIHHLPGGEVDNP